MNGDALHDVNDRGTLPPSRSNSIDERRASQRRMLAGFIALSLGLHLGLVAGWIFFPEPDKPALDLDEAIIKTKLVKLGKPRDEKLLPRIAASAPPPDAAKRAPPTDTPTPENPQKNPEKQPSAADILEQFKKDNQKPTDVNDIIRDRLGEPDDEGQLDGDREGVALTGEIKDAYFARVTAKIQKSHEISTTISPEEYVRLRAVVEFKIDGEGNILEPRIRQSSGNDIYDNGVLAAAKRASPVPAPPPQVRDLAARGVAVNVCPGPCS